MTQNPRLKMRPELKLYYLVMSVNANCNAQCKNCTGYISDEIAPMPLEKIKEVFDACILQGGIKYIFPSCTAEMTLHPDCVEIVKYFSTIKKSGLFVHQDTNARYIPTGFIAALNSVNCVYNLSISLWGGNSTDFYKYQGAGDFNATVNNIRLYLKELKNPPQFQLVYITQEQYQNTINLLESLITEAGYKSVIIEKDSLPSRMYMNKIHGLIPITVRRFVGNENRILARGVDIEHIPFNNCEMLYDRVVIHADGTIKPCLRVNFSEAHTIGNIYDYAPFTWNDLVSILHTEKAIDYIKRNFTPGEFACEECKNCGSRICS